MPGRRQTRPVRTSPPLPVCPAVAPHPVPAFSSPRTSPPAMRPAPTNPTQSSDASIATRGHAPRSHTPGADWPRITTPRSPIGRAALGGGVKGAKEGKLRKRGCHVVCACPRVGLLQGIPDCSQTFSNFPRSAQRSPGTPGPRRCPATGVGTKFGVGEVPKVVCGCGRCSPLSSRHGSPTRRHPRVCGGTRRGGVP